MVTTDYLQLRGQEVMLAVRVQPRASRSELAEPVGHELKVRVAAPPVDSAANDELLRFLAQQLGCPRHQLRLVRGRSSRHKLIAINGLKLDWIRDTLTR